MKKATLTLMVLCGAIFAGEDIEARFFASAMSLPVFSNPAPPSDDCAFADFLFENQLYEDAAGEYQKEAFLNRMSQGYDYASYQRALCLIRIRDFDGAAAVLDKLSYSALDREVSYRARLLRAIVEVARHNPHRAEFLLSTLLGDSPEFADEIHFWRGWIRLVQYDFDGALADFDAVCNTPERNPFYFSRAYGIKRWLDINLDKIPQKSPELARYLSGILPGAGQTYAGNLGAGLNSFVINGTLGYLTLSELIKKNYIQGLTIFTMLWNRYYFGGMINSQIMAENFNRRQYNSAVALLMDTYLAPPDSAFLPPEKPKPPYSDETPKFLNGVSVMALAFLNLYQKRITTQDAQKCQFRIGCSQFSKLSFMRHNPFMALLMTSDRLQRCNPFAHKYYPADSTGHLVDKLWGP
ncbi:membrane protein insertion efficiency factor YidD [bacterium]|nr:membrane protein insertion efficiency factor YidD [bacterium]